MAARLDTLTSRRRDLVERSDALRGDLQASASGIRRSVGIGPATSGAMATLRRHPALVVGVAVALLVAGPARVTRIAALGLGAWSLFRRVRGVARLLGRIAR